ncbi:hypothetical protein CJD44_04460 [Streptomyces sp. alain-838]|nr:hypothetical protein CJD44_04460 [Streptomyces sp. alain-838]
MAVLLGSPVVRVHRFKPPKSVVCRSPGRDHPPGLAAHRAVASGPGPPVGRERGGQPDLKPSLSISDSPGSRPVRDVTVS